MLSPWRFVVLTLAVLVVANVPVGAQVAEDEVVREASVAEDEVVREAKAAEDVGEECDWMQ